MSPTPVGKQKPASTSTRARASQKDKKPTSSHATRPSTPVSSALLEGLLASPAPAEPDCTRAKAVKPSSGKAAARDSRTTAAPAPKPSQRSRSSSSRAQGAATSARPAKRRRTNSDAASQPSRTREKSASQETVVDFEMLGMSDLTLMPWSPSVRSEDSIYLPPGVQGLIDGMQTALASESASRQKAEEQYMTELSRRVAAEQELEKLRGEVERLKTKTASSKQAALTEAKAGFWGSPSGEVDPPPAAEAAHPGIECGAKDASKIDATAQDAASSDGPVASSDPADDVPATQDTVPLPADGPVTRSPSNFVRSLPTWSVRDSLNRLFPSNGK